MGKMSEVIKGPHKVSSDGKFLCSVVVITHVIKLYRMKYTTAHK